MVIAGRAVGPGAPCLIIAEAGVNHNGDLGRAMALVDAAAEAGADAVKFQTFDAATLTTASAPAAAYQRERVGADSQQEMLAALELPLEAFEQLMAHCEKRGILFLSTPFDEESATALVRMGMAAIKVPSGEITNTRLLRHVASLGKPIILSTGMSTMAEVERAVATLGDSKHTAGIAILQCVTCYPAEPAETNLRAMESMARAFNVPVGLSDHSLGLAIPIAAAALGASIIEKHLTLDRTLPGPDHAASLEPNEMAELVSGVRAVEAALGDGIKRPVQREIENAAVVRRSVAAARDIAAGEVISAEHLAMKRPGSGLPPSAEAQLVGRIAKVDIPRDTLLAMEMVR